MPGKHQAAVVEKVGQGLTVIERDTPEPGPNDVLIEAKAWAVNPVDWYARDTGMPPIPVMPGILGEDVAGVVAKVGSNVKNFPAVGSKVIAFVSNFYEEGASDRGAFQKFGIARPEAVIPLPEKMSFAEGASLPLAVLTALTGYYTMGIPLETKFKPADKEAILIWGASSSVGTMGVQSAKTMGYTVYATAGSKNIDYIKSLGASKVFDYKDKDVVQKIVDQAKADGVHLRTAHVIVDGALQQTLDVLKQTKGDSPAKVAHAPLLQDGHPTLENTEIKFTYTPLDADERNEHIRKAFQGWLKPGLESGEVVASPPVQVIPGGVAGISEALDVLKKGVSCTKVVAAE